MKHFAWALTSRTTLPVAFLFSFMPSNPFNLFPCGTHDYDHATRHPFAAHGFY